MPSKAMATVVATFRVIYVGLYAPVVGSVVIVGMMSSVRAIAVIRSC
jgi:hypothetical protein